MATISCTEQCKVAKMYKNIKKRKYFAARTPSDCNCQLHFRARNRSFAKNNRAMCRKTFEEKYASFSEALEDGNVIMDGAVDFRSLCRSLKVAPGRLERRLVREIGIKGEEILSLWRSFRRESE